MHNATYKSTAIIITNAANIDPKLAIINALIFTFQISGEKTLFTIISSIKAKGVSGL